MAVDLQHSTGDTCSLPCDFLPNDDVLLLSHSQPNNSNNTRSDIDDDFIAELTHHMDRFLLQDDDDDKFDLSGIGGYHNSELSWDLKGSPQSTLWSNSNSNQGSSDGSSDSQEASPPPTPDSCNWNPTFDVTGGITINSRSYHTSFNPSNVDGLCSHQSLIQEQIKSIEMSRVKQERVQLVKQKVNACYGESEGQVIISQKSEGVKEREINESQKKGKGGGGVGRRTRPPRPSSPMHHQQLSGGGAMRAMFLGGSASRGGTGVFFPRSGTTAPPQTTKKQGKGCSTVLIPARVVQALQQHFDQMASTSGPKPAAAFPPLHDVLVSNRDGMYSLQKGQSRKSVSAGNVQNEVSLPQEWTY